MENEQISDLDEKTIVTSMMNAIIDTFKIAKIEPRLAMTICMNISLYIMKRNKITTIKLKEIMQDLLQSYNDFDEEEE